MKKREVLVNAFMLIGILLIIGTLATFIKPVITGLVIHEEFIPDIIASITYDPNKINISNNEFKLMQDISTNIITSPKKYNITSATYKSEDKLSKVLAIDDKKLLINKNKIFNIGFEDNLYNGDIITLYLLDHQQQYVYLCEESQECNPPGYGLLIFNGSEGFYNITIENLDNLTNKFNLDPPEIKIDYIEAIHFETTEDIIMSYQNLGEIETIDISPENISYWGYISILDNPKNQTINYYYSINSGETWVNLTLNNLTLINSSKIRFRIDLISDGTDTPILYGVNLSYFIEELNETEETNNTQEQSPQNQITSGSSSSEGGGSSDRTRYIVSLPVVEPPKTVTAEIIPASEYYKETQTNIKSESKKPIVETKEEQTLFEIFQDKITGSMIYTKDKVVQYTKGNWLLLFILGILIGVYIEQKIKFYKNRKRL